MTYGYTFAKRQCTWLGIDWRETLDKLNYPELEIVRIGAYWHKIEPKEDQYDFTDIIEPLEILKKQGKKVIVTVGMKAPRAPEYFIPRYIKDKGNYKIPNIISNRYLAIRCLKFIEQTVKELRSFENIIYWQIENEPFVSQKRDKRYITPGFLQEEINLVKELDNREIIINMWSNDSNLKKNIRTIQQLENINLIAHDIYPQQPYLDFLPFIDLYKGPSTSPESFNLEFKRLNEFGVKSAITELQTEPWEATWHKKGSAEIKSINLEKIKKNISNYDKLELEFTLLWGAEYWVWAGIEKELLDTIKTFQNHY